MKRQRRWIFLLLCISILLPLLTPILTLWPSHAAAEELQFGNSHITPYTDPNKDPTKRYIVALMSYSIWKDQAGNWSPKAPQSTVTAVDGLTWTYTFSFPGRSVRSVTPIKFSGSGTHVTYFEKSRATPYLRYADYMSTVDNVGTSTGVTGNGTATISYTLSPVGKLDGFFENLCEKTACGPGIEGHTYYFPIVIEFELDGMKTTSHYSTDGQNLMPAKIENMVNGQSYPTTVPTVADYEYEGYKESKTGTAPTGAIILGPPPPINNNGTNIFDGTYDQYQITLYYKKKVAAAGTINVRHMVRTTAGGAYTEKGESTISVATLPHSRTIPADSSYGTVKGQNVSYSGYSNTVNSGTSASVSLSAPSQKTAYVTFFYEKIASSFTGDFDVVPATIKYRESIKIQPKNFVMNGCTYQSHRYKIVRGAITYHTPPQYGMTTATSYSYSNYPSVIGVGTHSISLEIKTSCGTSEWIGPKTLTVESDPDNRPPEFAIGFVYPHSPTKAVTEVVEGTTLNLIYIEDPTIPIPRDPDGDDLYFDGFDLSVSSAWAKAIPSKYSEYTNGYHGIRMDGLGTHTVRATMRDEFGATTTRYATITVVPPNPIARITGPTEAKEGRPLAMPFSSGDSYSPVGRSIDHSKDEWGNKRSVYVSPGKEIVTLHVTDSIGLRSIQPAKHELTVHPDLPPVPELDIPATAMRGLPITLTEKSMSLDNDTIVETRLSYRYDADNDGNFTEHAETIVPLNASRKGNFQPTTVGKYQFRIYVKEDWGKNAAKEFILDVVNDTPFVSFTASGDSSPPPSFGSTYNISPSSLLGGAWTNTNGGKAWVYNSVDNALQSATRRANGIQYQSFLNYVAGGPVVWKGPDANITVSNNPTSYDDYDFSHNLTQTSGQRINLYGNYYLLKKDGTNGDAKKFEVYQGNGTLLRTYDRVSLYIDVENRLIYMIDSGNDYVYTFEQFVTGAAPSKKVQDNMHYWACGSTWCALVGSTEQVTGYKMLFNTGYKEVIANMNYPELYANLPDRIINYDVDRPWIETSTVNSSTDYPEGAFSITTHFKSKPHWMPSNYILGYDSKGNPYYSSYGYYSRHPNGDDSATFYRVSMTKLDGNNASFIGEYFENFGGSDITWSDMPIANGNGPKVAAGPLVSNARYAKVAYIHKNETFSSSIYKLVFRHEASGAVAHVVDVPATAALAGAYQDYVIIRHGGSLSAYRFSDGGLQWTVNSGVALLHHTLMSENGFLYYVANDYLQSVYLKTGAIKTVADLYSSFYPDGLYTRAAYTRSLAPCGGDGSLCVSGGPTGGVQIKGTIQENPELYDVYGQFYSASIPDQANFTASYKIKQQFDYFTPSSLSSGFSFRMANAQNMYRVEYQSDKIALVKIVEGTRTVLREVPFELRRGEYVSFTVKAVLDSIKVLVNNSPIIEVNDATFATGKFGPYANSQHVFFKDISLTTINITSSTTDNVALIGTPITYRTNYTDSENDPIAVAQWSYVQISQKFLDAGDGRSGPSAYSGGTYGSPIATLDKVGSYTVTHRVWDDPHPSYRQPSGTFNSYRAKSNDYEQSVIVHRRPVVDYDIAVNPDRTVSWVDRSHDPDRWLNAWTYSTEATGINYAVTRGILEKSFYYVSPSGKHVNEKLVIPTETGTYTIGMAVKDEYGAWSSYLERSITIGALPAPNDPPVAGFNLSHTITYRGIPVTIDSTASDREDGPRTNLAHEYYIRNLAGGSESLASTARTSWTKTFNSMGTFQFRQVVTDSVGQIAQASRAIQIINRKPVADVTNPSSSDQNNPQKITVFKPTFTWSYGDPDGDAQLQYHARIYRYGGILQSDTGVRSGTAFSWTSTADLPELVNMSVQVRVFDGYDWSDWSGPKYFYIETNRPPVADFDWQPDPIYEGDELRLLNRSYDPDADPLTYTWLVTAPDGAQKTYAVEEPRLPHVMPGQYRIRLTVFDGKVSDTHEENVTVRPLFIQGEVNHTEQWYAHHVEAGHETEHAPKDFYAGERLLIRAVVALGPVETVTARITAAGRAGGDLSVEEVLQPHGGPGQFAGDLYDERWASVTEGLEGGGYAVRFRVEYANGVEKETTVPLRIIGNVYENVGVHRRQ